MDRLQKMVSDALVELSGAARKIKTNKDYQDFITKFDASFEDGNSETAILESGMFSLTLEGYFDLSILDAQLNTILPDVCEDLGLRCVPNPEAHQFIEEDGVCSNAYLVHLL